MFIATSSTTNPTWPVLVSISVCGVKSMPLAAWALYGLPVIIKLAGFGRFNPIEVPGTSYICMNYCGYVGLRRPAVAENDVTWQDCSFPDNLIGLGRKKDVMCKLFQI